MPGSWPIMSKRSPPSRRLSTHRMMLGIVALDGKKMPPFWFPKGLEVCSQGCITILKRSVKLWLDATYPRGNCVWPAGRHTRPHGKEDSSVVQKAYDQLLVLQIVAPLFT